MITDLLLKATRSDVDLWVEGEGEGVRLFCETAGALPEPLRLELSAGKQKLIELLKENREMKKDGWIVFGCGDCYIRTLHERSSLVAQRNEQGRFELWRGTWKPGEPAPTYQSTLLKSATFEGMLKKAKDYLNYQGRRSR